MNKNKKLVVLLLVVALSTTSIFATTGLGIQGGVVGSNNVGGGVAVTFKIDKVPCVFAVDLGIGNNWFDIGVSADWWIQNLTILGPWKWFYGIGLGAYVDIIGNVGAGFGLGPRVLIGTNVFIGKLFEIYLQAAWQPMLCFGNIYANPPFEARLLYFPVNLGFRFWF